VKRRGPVIALTVLALAATACGTVTSTVFTQVGEAGVALPAECAAEIGDFLVAIEPVVSNVDFETATEEEISSLGGAMEAAGGTFDPEPCPDLDVDEARGAWLEIAAERAPATRGYIEYTYPGD
jgi:hypothetical protein